MVAETLLTYYMRRVTRRHFTIRKNFALPELQPNRDKSYSLYIHIPFCENQCPYCSFNLMIFESSLANLYFDNITRELEMYRDLGFLFDAVYIGGGTPTVLPDRLAMLLELIQSTWSVTQISVETHPDHLTPATIQTLKSSGVKRLSVGIQTFNRELLTRINRDGQHSSNLEVERKLALVKDQFETINIDMIYNFPSQTQSMLSEDLQTVRRLELDQVTFYPLMVTNGKLKQLGPERWRLNYRKERRFYRNIVCELKDVYEQASAWCFSRKNRRGVPGKRGSGMIDEYIVDHDEYAGLGAGAFGYINGILYANVFDVRKYISLVQQRTFPVTANKVFKAHERIRYDFLMKLFGTSLERRFMEGKYGRFVWFYLLKELFFFLATGAVNFKNGTFTVVPRKKYYLVILMREFFTGVNHFREICTEGIENAGVDK